MSQYWERLFIAVARIFGWSVAAVPVAAVLILLAAFILGQRPSVGVEFARVLFSQFAVTLFIAILATVVGATLGMGCALFSHELARGVFAHLISLHAKFLAAAPAVVIGWFAVTVLLPGVRATQGSWVLLVVVIAIATAVLPDGYILTVRAVRALPAELLEAAAALGANATQVISHVVLPGSLARLIGIYAAVFSRALPEATAASIIFLYAARAGYPVSRFSLSAVLLAQGTAFRSIDSSMALAALLVLGLSVAARVVAARRIGGLEWV